MMVRGRYVWDAEKGEEGLMGGPRYDHKKLEARIHRTTEKYGPFAGKIGSFTHGPFGPEGVRESPSVQTSAFFAMSARSANVGCRENLRRPE
jgi:hypothetical protein